MNNITFGDEDTGYYETVAGGAGAVCIQFLFFEKPPQKKSFLSVEFWNIKSCSERQFFTLTNNMFFKASIFCLLSKKQKHI